MRHPYLLFSLALLPLSFSCSSDLTEEVSTPSHQVNKPMAGTTDETLFPQEDGSPRLSYDPAEALSQLMKKFDPNKALIMGETEITEAEFQEIKEFVDKELKAETPYDTYRKIFNWITKNIRYAGADETAYLNPYDVFKYRVCVCQGYANLLKTMCISQGIPTIGINGWLSNIGGHAWNYVYVGDKWYVSDATNKSDYQLNQLDTYRNWLIPTRTDLTLFEDDKFAYTFLDNQLTLSEIKQKGGNIITVPYSVGGYKITSFCPQMPVDSTFTQVYIGRNIECLGNEPSKVIDNFPSLEAIYIKKGNPRLEAINSLVYMDGNETPYFVPPAIRRVELRPMKVVEKNTLYDLPNVEEIVVADGTVRIENYAFEKCPKLLRVYVPKSVTYIARQALYNCNKDAEIIREQTGITEVTW